MIDWYITTNPSTVALGSTWDGRSFRRRMYCDLQEAGARCFTDRITNFFGYDPHETAVAARWTIEEPTAHMKANLPKQPRNCNLPWVEIDHHTSSQFEDLPAGLDQVDIKVWVPDEVFPHLWDIARSAIETPNRELSLAAGIDWLQPEAGGFEEWVEFVPGDEYGLSCFGFVDFFSRPAYPSEVAAE